MAERNYGTRLDPKRTLKVKKGVKGERKVLISRIILQQ